MIIYIFILNELNDYFIKCDDKFTNTVIVTVTKDKHHDVAHYVCTLYTNSSFDISSHPSAMFGKLIISLVGSVRLFNVVRTLFLQSDCCLYQIIKYILKK